MASGNRIAKLRRMQGLRLEDVAAHVGKTAPTVNRWERGESRIPDELKPVLAELFGVSVVFLMGWEHINGDGNDEGVAA